MPDERRRADDDFVGVECPVQGDQTVALAVVRAVAVVTNKAPSDREAGALDELEPLAETVNPDALNALFGDDGQDSPREVEITFDYAGCRVTVGPGPMVVVEPME